MKLRRPTIAAVVAVAIAAGALAQGAAAWDDEHCPPGSDNPEYCEHHHHHHHHHHGPGQWDFYGSTVGSAGMAGRQ